MSGEFSVWQFFPDETGELVSAFVDPETAVRTAFQLSHSLAAQVGVTARVIIVDGDDFTTFEWKFGEGVVFPTRADMEHP